MYAWDMGSFWRWNGGKMSFGRFLMEAGDVTHGSQGLETGDECDAQTRRCPLITTLLPSNSVIGGSATTLGHSSSTCSKRQCYGKRIQQGDKNHSGLQLVV